MTSPKIFLSLSIALFVAFGPTMEALIAVQLTGMRPGGDTIISIIKGPSKTTSSPYSFRRFSAQENVDTPDESGPTSAVEEELERLKEQLSLIEALEARNEAQLESFVDEEDQWNSMEQDERDLLEAKDSIIQRMELLTEQLIQLWMGQKSMEG